MILNRLAKKTAYIPIDKARGFTPHFGKKFGRENFLARVDETWCTSYRVEN